MNKISTEKRTALAAVLSAVQECRAKPLGDPQRIIVVQTAQGVGMSQLYRQALRHRGAILVPAGAMDRNRVRFIKLLAHRTRFVPVLVASVDEWRNWHRRQPLTSAQIRRRTFMTIELESPSLDQN